MNENDPRKPSAHQGTDTNESNPTHQHPAANNQRESGTERSDQSRQQGGSHSPDMKSHQGAGTSSQEDMARRSNEAGDQDTEEPVDVNQKISQGQPSGITKATTDAESEGMPPQKKPTPTPALAGAGSTNTH